MHGFDQRVCGYRSSATSTFPSRRDLALSPLLLSTLPGGMRTDSEWNIEGCLDVSPLGRLVRDHNVPAILYRLANLEDRCLWIRDLAKRMLRKRTSLAINADDCEFLENVVDPVNVNRGTATFIIVDRDWRRLVRSFLLEGRIVH